MYYNESSDRLFVCTTGYNRIDILNHELKLNKSISTYPYSPVDIEVDIYCDDTQHFSI
jgi:hypothetical protein